MAEFWIGGGNPLVSLDERDLVDFLAFLKKDVAYRQKRSRRHARENPEAGDKNAPVIAGRRRLIADLDKLLSNRREEART